MKKRWLVGLMVLVMALCGCMVACGGNESEAMTKDKLGAETLKLMVSDLPGWAGELTQQDITFTICENGYENKIVSATASYGTYTYDEMTGEYKLSDGGVLRETSNGYSYVKGDTQIELVAYAEAKKEIVVLTGTASIKASGLYDMEIEFSIHIYDGGTFEVTNRASATTMTGTWTREGDGPFVLTGEGISVSSSTINNGRAYITATFNFVGSDQNTYSPTVELMGRL